MQLSPFEQQALAITFALESAMESGDNIQTLLDARDRAIQRLVTHGASTETVIKLRSSQQRIEARIIAEKNSTLAEMRALHAASKNAQKRAA